MNTPDIKTSDILCNSFENDIILDNNSVLHDYLPNN